MTEHELRVCFGLAWNQLVQKKKAHKDALAAGDHRHRAEIRRVNEAMQALVAMKDFAKQHTEESPEQVELFDVPERGGY